MAISMARAKVLCNATELSLLQASSRNEIGKLSAAQLKQKITRARTLRDKWTDQARTQRRATQSAQRSRQTDANARSAEKAELFGAALAQFEARLEKLEAKGKATGPAVKKLAPRARSATHRAARAEVRDSLKQEKLALSKKKKSAKPKAAKPAEAVEVFPSDEDQEAEAPVKPTIPPARSKGKKSHGGSGLTALQSARELQGLRVTKEKQRSALTAAKQTRLRESGLLRVQKSTSAVNRRRQAKRDSR